MAAPPAVNAALLSKEAVERAVLFCVTNGITTATKDGFHHCPVMAAPTPFPKKQFERARAAQPAFNKLVDGVSRDFAFLEETLGATAKADPFTGKLYEIFQKVYCGAKAAYQPLMLGMHRADYMLDTSAAASFSEWTAKQIEINTIASAFAGLSSLTNKFHQFAAAMEDDAGGAIPLSESDLEFPKGLATAFYAQAGVSLADGASPDRPRVDGVVLFVIQPGERNVDRALLSQVLFSKFRVKTIERTLDEIAARGSLGADNGLVVDGHAVRVAYFRAGYTPDDYEVAGGAGGAWDARLMMEQSSAVKCPSIPYHLAGTKKIQQVLCDGAVLRRFLSEAEAAEAMSFFATMSGLEDSPASAEVIRAALAAPDDWLLKPQREGGGNLIFGEAMTEVLAAPTEDNKSEFILMKKIRPPPVKSAVIRAGVAHHEVFISELGIYGLYLGDGTATLINVAAGHLLRSKPEHKADGGVASGVAALDSVQLVE
eukprot:TRINITY_DN15033_c0_g1_i2.p1 TRINITY_DN15033_c0_g1~~TRINITY_DN15033_c0_g1_i2.p1  ORF type:complete len:485 (+),score=177.56 TRINITY_DN15033_c0_g1_i2:76-1530(+)